VLSLAIEAKSSPSELSCHRIGQSKGCHEAMMFQIVGIAATPFAHHRPNRRLAWGRREILRFSANAANPTLHHR
jgi:hypothetical protein